MKTGKCKVELAITVNTGNFSSIKATVGFEESYDFNDDSTGEVQRDEKYEELLGVCNDKLDEAVLIAVKKVKAIQK